MARAQRLVGWNVTVPVFTVDGEEVSIETEVDDRYTKTQARENNTQDTA